MSYLLMFLVICLPITGMVYAVLGSLKLPLAERLNMDEAKVGGLVSAYGFMVGPIILIAGFVTDAIGRKGVWITGSVLVAAALLTLARTRRYPVALLAVLLLSTGWAAMINVGNVLMPLAIPGNPSKATNFLDFWFGVGAFLAPTTIVLLLRRTGYTATVSALAGLAVMPAILAVWAQMHETATVAASTAAAGGAAQAAAGADTASLLGDPVMWLSGLTLMFFVPLESSTAAWVTTLVTRRAPDGESEASAKRVAAWTLSGFWLCFMGARLVTSGFIHAEAEHLLHLVLAVAITLVLAAMTVVKERRAMIALLILSGVLFGPFFPTLMGILLGHFPSAVHGRAVGILFGLGSVGWTIIPALIGAYAARTDIQKSFRVAAAAGVVLIALVTAHYMHAQGERGVAGAGQENRGPARALNDEALNGEALHALNGQR